MVTAAAKVASAPVPGPGPVIACNRGHSPMQHGGDSTLLRLLAGGPQGFDANGELCILEGRLYLASLRRSPVADPNKYYITLTQKMRYVPYCADFGPYNLGTLHHICQALDKTIRNEKEIALVYYTSQEPADVTNAIFLLGAFLCLKLGATPDEAWQPFKHLARELVLPYRDATWVRSTYDLHVRDCWAGLVKAVEMGMYRPATFDKNEYFYYDDPDNGDLHMVVPGKFLAFRGPREVDDNRGSLEPADYVEVFKSMGVQGIVRLNKAEYNRSAFVRAGFAHHELVFDDCSVPPSHIVDAFLRRAEALEHGQVLAVHCLAGLGRTGTLIALYMMKHYKFTANEAMGWLRVCRPGSIIGPQQRYLADMEAKMHELGAAGVDGLGKTLDQAPSLKRSPSQQNYAVESGVEQSKVLAEMVTDGMWNRKAQRHAQKDGYADSQASSTRSFLPWLGKNKQPPGPKMRRHSPGPQPGGQVQAGKTQVGSTTGGLLRSKSGGCLDDMKGATRYSAPQGPKQSRAMPKRDSGYGGTNSLKKSGSFNNMSSNATSVGRLLSSPSNSSADDQHSSGSDDDDNEALEQFLADFERKRSAGEDPPVAGSLCFGGMEKLHANALQRLAATEMGNKDGERRAAGFRDRSSSDSTQSSVSSGVSGNWSLLSYFKKGDRDSK